MTAKPNICVDFDGVLNNYKGYKGSDELYEPSTGAKEFLQKLSEKYTVIILSARTPAKIYDWLIEHDLSQYVCDVTRTKPGAIAYIDDRALRFDGNYDKVLYELERFQAHWEKEYVIIGDGRYTNPKITEDGDRFQLAYESDNGWWAVNDNGVTLWKEEVVYTMNELFTECNQLKQSFDTIDKVRRELIEENKQLKYHLDKTEKELQEYKDFMSLG